MLNEMHALLERLKTEFKFEVLVAKINGKRVDLEKPISDPPNMGPEDLADVVGDAIQNALAEYPNLIAADFDEVPETYFVNDRKIQREMMASNPVMTAIMFTGKLRVFWPVPDTENFGLVVDATGNIEDAIHDAVMQFAYLKHMQKAVPRA